MNVGTRRGRTRILWEQNIKQWTDLDAVYELGHFKLGFGKKEKALKFLKKLKEL